MIKAMLVKKAVYILISELPDDAIIECVDSILDTIENKIKSTDNKLDDALILPIIDKARKALNVPDGDD